MYIVGQIRAGKVTIVMNLNYNYKDMNAAAVSEQIIANVSGALYLYGVYCLVCNP